MIVKLPEDFRDESGVNSPELSNLEGKSGRMSNDTKTAGNLQRRCPVHKNASEELIIQTMQSMKGLARNSYLFSSVELIPGSCIFCLWFPEGESC